MEVKNHINNTLATAKRWPRPLNRGGRWIEVSNTAVYWQINRDFGKWPLNGGWPLNRWPLNRGRTVAANWKFCKKRTRKQKFRKFQCNLILASHGRIWSGHKEMCLFTQDYPDVTFYQWKYKEKQSKSFQHTNNYRFDCGFVLKCFSNSPIFRIQTVIAKSLKKVFPTAW